MAFFETLLAAIGLASNAVDIRAFINEKLDERVQPETVLADLTEEGFREQISRLRHLCPDGDPRFEKGRFVQQLNVRDIEIINPGDLLPALVVTDCNGNGSGLQSTEIWDYIMCISPAPQDRIPCI
jgi:hypothetical protein